MESPSSPSDDDGPSNATILLGEQMDREFKKAFPLRKEVEEALLKTVRPDGSRRRKLDFDLLDSPKESTTTSQKSMKLQLELSQKRAETLEQENLRLKGKDEASEYRIQQLLDVNTNLREKAARAEALLYETELVQKSNIAEVEAKYEDCRGAVRKYYIWYQVALAQLNVIKNKLSSSATLLPSDIHEINKMTYTVMNEMVSKTFDHDVIEGLTFGSLREFTGVEMSIPPEEDPEESRIFANVSKVDASIVEGARATEEPSFMSAITANETLMNVSLNDTLANSSINYEKDEKIQRLLLENSILKDKLDVSCGRAQQSMLLEEKNRSLEMKNEFLQKKLDMTFGEIESMRMGIAKKIFVQDPRQTTDKTLKMVDRLRDLIADNNQLEKNVEAATSKITKLVMDSRLSEQRYSHLEDAYSEAMEEKQKTLNELVEVRAKLEQLTEELDQVRGELEKLKKEKETRTDAGDTTQIFHMPNNPLKMAIDEHESRKRKLSEPDTTLTAKRQRDDEEVKLLEEKLKKSEREKEEAVSLQMDLLKKFREVSTALTGFQIKLKDVDNGICSVNSVYTEGRGEQFVFKYHYNTGGMDLLDVGGSDSEMIQLWEGEMRRYIGERQSVPSFLAAVTLRLEQERAEEQMAMLERTHTFSVLHE